MSWTKRPSGTAVRATLVLSVAFGIAAIGIANGAVGDPVLVGKDQRGFKTSFNAKRAGVTVPPGTGLLANGDFGLVGTAGSTYTTVPDEAFLSGVTGLGNDTGGYFRGVDQGVVATADNDGGTGVDANGTVAIHAQGETALVANGVVEVNGQLTANGETTFTGAGFARINPGHDRVTVTPGVSVSAGSKVFATVQSRGGTLLRVGRNVPAGTITIVLVAAVTRSVRVAYFVVG
jgi:hypothetical protein